MKQTGTDVNRMVLHGRVAQPPALSHRNHEVEFFSFPLAVSRLSGVADQVNVVASRALLGEEITVHGEVRTFNNRSGVGSRLIISVFAKELLLEQGEDENRLLLSGTLCKPPSLRSTPLGRTICDMILAVNRRYGRADYLPCIAWGSLAHQCGGLEVGSTLCFEGRLQSRTYTKNLGDRTEERVAFEVSVMNFAGKGTGSDRPGRCQAAGPTVEKVAQPLFRGGCAQDGPRFPREKSAHLAREVSFPRRISPEMTDFHFIPATAVAGTLRGLPPGKVF